MKIAISACLLGDNVRYDGSNKKNNELISLLKNYELVKICPEISAGFSVPRKPLEIRDNKAYTSAGDDLTYKLSMGCEKEFERIKECDFVILKSKSPSCGLAYIYDGTFSNTLIQGNGLFTKMCIENGIKVFSENDFEEIKKELSKLD